MRITFKPLWHQLLEKDMRKEDLRVAAKLTTNMIANMTRDKYINMDTLVRICETLSCDITDVIALTNAPLPEDKEQQHEKSTANNP